VATDKGFSLIALPQNLKKESATHSSVLNPLSEIPRRQKCLEDPEPAAKGRNAYEVPPGDRFQAKVPAPDPVPGRRQADLPIRPELRASCARRFCLGGISQGVPADLPGGSINYMRARGIG